MSEAEKLELLAEAMDVEVDELHAEDKLAGNEAWDSLSMLAFMASVSSKCRKRITPGALMEVVTVQDALDLI